MGIIGPPRPPTLDAPRTWTGCSSKVKTCLNCRTGSGRTTKIEQGRIPRGHRLFDLGTHSGYRRVSCTGFGADGIGPLSQHRFGQRVRYLHDRYQSFPIAVCPKRNPPMLANDRRIAFTTSPSIGNTGKGKRVSDLRDRFCCLFVACSARQT